MGQPESGWKDDEVEVASDEGERWLQHATGADIEGGGRVTEENEEGHEMTHLEGRGAH